MARGATLTLNVAADPTELIKQLDRSVQAVQQFARKTVQAGPGSAASLDRTARAARGVAGGLEEIARSGDLAGGPLKGILKDIGEIAFGFGPEGAIVGALAITGTAIYEHVTRQMDDAKKAAKDAAVEIAKLANAGDVGKLQAQYRTLLYGKAYNEETGNPNNPSAVPGAVQGSLLDLRNRVAHMDEQARGLVRGYSGNRQFFKDYDDLKARLDAAELSARKLKAAIENIQSQPALNSGGLLPALVSTATTGTGGGLAITPELRAQLEKANAETVSALAAAEAQRQGQVLTDFNNPKIRTPGALPGINTIGPQNAALIPPQVAQIPPALTKSGDKLAAGLKAGFDAVANSIGIVLANKLVASIYGAGAGANAGSTFGGMFGGAIAKGALGSAAGAMAGSVVPVIGTIAGSLIGGAIGSLFDHPKKAADASASALDKLTKTTERATEAIYNMAEGFLVTRARIEATFLQGQGFARDATKQAVTGAQRNMARGGSGFDLALTAGARA